jgi:GNAT superfamily N-acetyltransferase
MQDFVIKQCEENDFGEIYEIINDAAVAYKSIIPEDRYHEPYMSEEELKTQIAQGVKFWSYIKNDTIMGVMGIQDKGLVTLIRHAYVRTIYRKAGIGSALLRHLLEMTSKPVLIGTWADAKWAIEFYQKHGFRLTSKAEKENLLRRFWTIPERQVETSVVLVNDSWQTKSQS